MQTEIIIGFLSLIGTLSGSYFGVRASNNLIAYRLEELEKKVNKHNNVIERTYKLEERMSVNENNFKVANNRIKDLEEKE